jgi:hypothetical protein
MDHRQVQHDPQHFVRMCGVLHPFDTQDNRFPGKVLNPGKMCLGTLPRNERETHLALQSQKAQACQSRFAYLRYWDLKGGLDYQVLYLT